MKFFLRGYTLMEMMAVLAIMMILALMTVPSYLDRIVRQQIEAALPLADVAKKPIADAWSLLHMFPADNAAVGLPAPDKVVNNYVSSLTVQDGVIHVTFGNRVNKSIVGKTLSLRPAVVVDAPVVPVAWVCGKAPAPDKMTLMGEDRTTVPAELLPSACR
jgi:type IV pilus assembly protein PilA